MPSRSFKIVYDNDNGSLVVGLELYHKPHPKAGEYNPVYKAKIRLHKGDTVQKINLKTKNYEVAIREAQKRLDQALISLVKGFLQFSFVQIVELF